MVWLNKEYFNNYGFSLQATKGYQKLLQYPTYYY